MILDISHELISFIVSKFFSPELDAIKTKCYFFDGSIKTNVICRHQLENIYLNSVAECNSEEEFDSDSSGCTRENYSTNIEYLSESDDEESKSDLEDEDPK
jgi:hypothetical protein